MNNKIEWKNSVKCD